MSRSLDDWMSQSQEWQHAYLEGSQDAHREAQEATPPWLRRFFWWPLHTITEENRGKRLWLGGGDEYCNDTIGIRLKGGVLFIRRNWRVRLEPHPDCPKCKES